MSNSRASTWSVTINNPTKEDEEQIALARQRGWKVIGQLEKGENGTPHYQLMVTTGQVRFSAVKKAFSRAHIEVARNKTALENYVVKADTRVAALTKSQDLYPSQSRVFDWFALACGRDFGSYVLNSYKGHSLLVAQNVTSRIPKREYYENCLLEQFDQMIEEKIRQGYYCEMIACNPLVRSAIKKYGFSIIARHFAPLDPCATHSQGGSQTDSVRLEDEDSVEVDITTFEDADVEESTESDES